MKKWFWALLLLPVLNTHARIKQAVTWRYHIGLITGNEYKAVLSA